MERVIRAWDRRDQWRWLKWSQNEAYYGIMRGSSRGAFGNRDVKQSNCNQVDSHWLGCRTVGRKVVCRHESGKVDELALRQSRNLLRFAALQPCSMLRNYQCGMKIIVKWKTTIRRGLHLFFTSNSKWCSHSPKAVKGVVLRVHTSYHQLHRLNLPWCWLKGTLDGRTSWDPHPSTTEKLLVITSLSILNFQHNTNTFTPKCYSRLPL